MQNLRKIAIYGGAFDPVHFSHINLIKQILKMPQIDEIWLLPSGERTDKKLLISMQMRTRFLQNLFNQNKKVKINLEQIELSKKQKRMVPTYELLQYFYKKYEGYKFYYTIGGDNVKNLKFWHNGEKLFNQTYFIIFGRKGFAYQKNQLPPHCLFNTAQLDQISSSEVKRIINSQMSSQQKSLTLEKLVPQIVMDYLIHEKII